MEVHTSGSEAREEGEADCRSCQEEQQTADDQKAPHADGDVLYGGRLLHDVNVSEGREAGGHGSMQERLVRPCEGTQESIQAE